MANKVPDNIEFAGDYDLKNIFLHNHFGEVIDISPKFARISPQRGASFFSQSKTCVSGSAEN